MGPFPPRPALPAHLGTALDSGDSSWWHEGSGRERMVTVSQLVTGHLWSLFRTLLQVYDLIYSSLHPRKVAPIALILRRNWGAER